MLGSGKNTDYLRRFTCLDVTIKWGDANVIHDITGKIFSSSDGMIADFRDEPSDVCHEINHPFTVRSLLSNPLQVIELRYLLI